VAGPTPARVAVALSLWLVVPISSSPWCRRARASSAATWAPAEPVFYLLVAAGCIAIAGRRSLVAAALASGVVALSVSERVDRLRTIHELGLRDLVAAVDGDAIVFSSTGTPVADRPPELIDDYLDLEGVTSAGWRSCRESTCASSRTSSSTAGQTWRHSSRKAREAGASGSFAGPERRVTRAVRRLAGDRELVAVQPSPNLLLVRSRSPVAPAKLVEQAIRARTAWTLNSPADRWTTLLLAIDRSQR
jgi:hypothetical protein